VEALAAEVVDAGLKTAAEAALEEATEGLYHSIFGPGGPAPAREVSYHESIQLGSLMAEIASFYDAFVYRPATPEAVDHISVEVGFIGYLRLKESYALACADSDSAAITAESARRFIDNHLSVMAEPLAEALSASGVRYLALAGASLLGRVGFRRQKVAAPHSALLFSNEEDGFECGPG
jgi:nitrate reductase assembly molybdenum cofactor insertion protein NarJ